MLLVLARGGLTGSIDDVTVGLKAAREISYGSISGPSCQNCELTIAMDPTQVITAVPVMHAYLVHNKETDANTRIKITVRDSAGNLFYRWVSKRMTFKKGKPFSWDAPIPGMPLPPPGVYTVRVGVKSMAGWVGKSTTFEVLAP